MTEQEFQQYCDQEGGLLVCYHDVKGHYLMFNDALTQLTGYTKEDIIGRSPYDFFHQEDLIYIQKNSHEPSVQGEEGLKIEYRFRKKDGNYIWLKTTTLPQKNDSGEVTGLITKSIDVSEHVKLKDEINRLETQKRILCDMTNIGTWEMDIPSMNIHWSDETRRIHEVDDDFEPGLENAISFFAGDSQEKMTKAVEDAIELQQPYDLEVAFKTAKGNKLWVRAIGKPLIRNGQTVKIFGVFQNVTRQVEDKEKMQALVSELQKNNDLLKNYLITFTPVS